MTASNTLDFIYKEENSYPSVQNARLFEMNMYKQIAYVQQLRWIVGTSGKHKKERQLLTEYDDLGNKANPWAVYGHWIGFIFV